MASIARFRPEGPREPTRVRGASSAAKRAVPDAPPTLTAAESLPPHIRAVLFGDQESFPTAPATPAPARAPVAQPSRQSARIVQSGNHVFERKAAVALNRFHALDSTKEDWGKALEDLKVGNGIPPRAVLAISEEGHVFEGDAYLGNLLPYLSGLASGHRGHLQHRG